MSRFFQGVLILSTLALSWLLMQAVHEAGHVLGAWLTGGRVAHVVLHPLTISRTELAHNPRPLVVVWAGPMFGSLVPLAAWGLATLRRWSFGHLPRFFAGFCLIANGAYIGLGWLDRVGDAGDLLKHGASVWQLVLFGSLTVPLGFYLWHGLGVKFGLGPVGEKVRPATAYGVLLALAVVAGLMTLFGERGASAP